MGVGKMERYKGRNWEHSDDEPEIKIKPVTVTIETINLEPGDVLIFRVLDPLNQAEMILIDSYLKAHLPKDTHFIVVDNNSVEITKVHQE